MKKIVFVVTSPYAVNAFLASHIVSLSVHFQIYLITNLKASVLQESVYDHVTLIDVRIAREISIVQDLIALVVITKTLFKIRPDATHSLTPKAGLLAMLAAKITRVPFRFHTFTGQVWENMFGFRRFFFKSIDRLIVALTTEVFADSPSQCDFLQKSNVLGAKELSVLGPGSMTGVDINRFKYDEQARLFGRSMHDVKASAIIFLFVGRLNHDKGINDILNVFEKYGHKHSNWLLWLVGPDEGGFSDLIKSNSNSRKIRWFGQTPNPEQFMMAADILLLPSYREGFGSVIIEAASCGVPAIGYKTHGVVDAIEPEVTGCLVDKGNIENFYLAMARLANDPEKRNNFANAAQCRVKKRFSDKIVIKAWINFYLCRLVGGAQKLTRI